MDRIKILGMALTIVVFCFVATGAYADGEWEAIGDNIHNTNSGNVGIGTTVPLDVLHIRAASSVGSGVLPLLRLENYFPENAITGDGQAIQFFNTWASGSNPRAGIEMRYKDDTVGRTSLVFRTRHNSTYHESMTIDHTGYVGIGTNSPSAKLDVAGNAYFDNMVKVSGTAPIFQLYDQDASVNHKYYRLMAQVDTLYLQKVNDAYDMPTNLLTFAYSGTATFGNNIILGDGKYLGQASGPQIIFDDTNNYLGITGGNVGIGTTSPQSKLAVDGTITATEVKVTTDGWSDFVFEDSYKLPSLDHVENYIKENKHLPDIPSAEQIAQDGLSMSEMMAKQMQKIEELTLYVIELKKENESLKIQVTKMSELEARINAIEGKK